MNKISIKSWKELADRTPACALLADVDGDNLICGVHGWDYRLDTGISEFSIDDLTTCKTDMAQLTGVAYGGVGAL
jgi:hypothetical protein